ncbi:MAG: polysaccharide deacetylase family protein [Ginsengibacter sp.]
MSLFKSIYYNCSSAFPLAFLKRLYPSTCLLPYHHIVSDEDVWHIKHLYNYKNVSQFKNDLEILLKNFKPISASDLIQYIQTNNQLPKNTFLLSFDDGFREVNDVIAPLLEAKGVPAIFFINPAFIDNKKLFYRGKTSLLIHELLKNKKKPTMIHEIGDILNTQKHTIEVFIGMLKKLNNTDEALVNDLAQKLSLSFDEYLVRQKPFLTTEQLTSLDKRGFTIGAHSWSHPYYDKISFEDQLEETISSCNFVKEKTKQHSITFSFPYSDNAVSQNLFDALHKTEIDLMFGIQNQKVELNNNMVHRFNAERPGISLDKQLKGIMLFMAIQKKMGKQTVLRK